MKWFRAEKEPLFNVFVYTKSHGRIPFNGVKFQRFIGGFVVIYGHQTVTYIDRSEITMIETTEAK